MGKMIKPLVVVLLVLSIVALVLGSMLYSKRELVKGRVLKLESGIEKIAKSLRYEGFKKTSLAIDKKENLPNMDQPIKDVILAGDLLFDDLKNTKGDLAKSTADLAEAKDNLVQTQDELKTSQQIVNDLQNEVDTARTELEEVRMLSDQLEAEKENMQTAIDDQASQVANLLDEKQDMSDQLASLKKAVSDLEAEFNPIGTQAVPKDLAGNIIAINPFWNFVILDIGKDDGLIVNTDMLVHRDDRLIGKVRISNIKDDMAIAEIVNDWEQIPIREGDHVLF